MGRKLVDGARHITLWGESVKVAAKVHTIGGLSAHANQTALKNWYSIFNDRPRLVLVHGEPEAQECLAKVLRAELNANVIIAQRGQKINLIKH